MYLAIVRWLSFKKTKFCDMLDKSVKFFLAFHMNIRSQKKIVAPSLITIRRACIHCFVYLLISLFFFNIKVS